MLVGVHLYHCALCWDGPHWRYTSRCEPVPEIGFVWGCRSSGIRGSHLYLGVDRGRVPSLAERLVHEQDRRHLEPPCEVERPGGPAIRLACVHRRNDKTRELSLARMAGEEELGLAGVGGEARARAGPLAEHDDDRHLRHARKGEAFGHQAESAAGGTDGAPAPGVCCSERHQDHGDLALGMDDGEVRPLGEIGKKMQDAGGRGHGIGDVGIETAANQTERDRLVPGQHRQWFAIAARDPELGFNRVERPASDAKIDLGMPVKLPHKDLLYEGPRYAGHPAEGADHPRVACDRGGASRRQHLIERDRNPLRLLHGRRVVQEHSTGIEPAVMPFHRFAVQGEDHVDTVAVRPDGVVRRSDDRIVMTPTDQGGVIVVHVNRPAEPGHHPVEDSACPVDPFAGPAADQHRELFHGDTSVSLKGWGRIKPWCRSPVFQRGRGPPFTPRHQPPARGGRRRSLRRRHSRRPFPARARFGGAS
ncbi:hypothetical protein DSECCO2_409350 [anaerobic digester metagenome]